MDKEKLYVHILITVMIRSIHTDTHKHNKQQQ